MNEEQSQHPFKDKVTAVIMMISKAQEFASQLLDHPDLAHLKIRVENDLGKPVNYLNGLIGHVIDSKSSNAQEMEQFRPVTHMFGEEIKMKQPVKEADVHPDLDEKALFLQKRDDLYDRFLDMNEDDVFTGMLEPKGEALVRSVAKRAGLEGFKDRMIDVTFIADVQELIREQIMTEEDEAAAKLNAGATGENEDHANINPETGKAFEEPAEDVFTGKLEEEDDTWKNKAKQTEEDEAAAKATGTVKKDEVKDLTAENNKTLEQVKKEAAAGTTNTTVKPADTSKTDTSTNTNTGKAKPAGRKP